MIRKIGLLGILGFLLALLGFGVLAYVNPLIAAGVALIVLGVAALIGNVVRRTLANLGLGGMF